MLIRLLEEKSVKSQSSQFAGNAEEEGGFAQQSCSTTMALVLILIIGVSLFLRPINEGLKPKPPSNKANIAANRHHAACYCRSYQRDKRQLC